MEQSMQHGADRAHSLRGIIVLFQLSENLRLADDHGIQARRYPEQMAHGITGAIFIDMLIQRGGMALGLLRREKRRNFAQSRVLIRSSRNDLDAIAGRQNNAFKNGWTAV